MKNTEIGNKTANINTRSHPEMVGRAGFSWWEAWAQPGA